MEKQRKYPGPVRVIRKKTFKDGIFSGDCLSKGEWERGRDITLIYKVVVGFGKDRLGKTVRRRSSSEFPGRFWGMFRKWDSLHSWGLYIEFEVGI
ncbi:hypothetical protein NPIL_451211 [Nephila pilipes]|uniref:Uncharacterized protein n=1 Tax=Nephila pilipes TaxID=299642 RepID=A0A8X6NFX4_NEPPI|nr:hypothetical protein NPIL_451211 [Nephila pilipes]